MKLEYTEVEQRYSYYQSNKEHRYLSKASLHEKRNYYNKWHFLAAALVLGQFEVGKRGWEVDEVGKAV